MAGESNLATLIKEMKPELQSGEYVFATFSDSQEIPDVPVIASVHEEEGITLVLEKDLAMGKNIPFEFTYSWITLKIHSSLEAVGLTAAFSSELAKHQISCNVIAGYYHDHIFVSVNDRERAVKVLESLTGNYGRE